MHGRDRVGNDADNLPPAIAVAALNSRTERGEYLSGADSASGSELVLRPQEQAVAGARKSEVHAMFAVGVCEPIGPDVHALQPRSALMDLR
jgi:hypothetical protein